MDRFAQGRKRAGGWELCNGGKTTGWGPGGWRLSSKWTSGCKVDFILCQVGWPASIQRNCSVVKAYETCQLIDPASVHWKKEKLGVKDNWNTLAMDITHHNGENFLTIIDCAPSRFTIWWPLHRQDAPTVIWQLRECFPRARNWDVHLRFRCIYSPSGNGIVERSHRTVKTIAARKNCSILEAVYWHNVTPKVDVSPCTTPADVLHKYHVWIKGVEDNPLPEPKVTRGKYEKGDVVWVKNPLGKCTTKYSTGHVTEVISPQSVKIDEVPRHIKDIRPVIQTQLS